MKLCDEQQRLPLAIASDSSKLLHSLPRAFPTQVHYRTYLTVFYANTLPV